MVAKTLACIAIFYGFTGKLISQDDSLKQSIKRGEEVYKTHCTGCHMPVGEGVEAVFPPLANTVYIKDQNRAIGILLNGQEGEISVNGKKYNTPMPAVGHLNDIEISDVLNYVSNSWGNKNPQIKPAQVKMLRKK